MEGWCSECNWYCWLCRRMEILLSLTESTGWSWLLWMYQTKSTDSTRYQNSKFGLWSPVLKAKKLTIIFTDMQCVVFINCLPQTVQAVICCLVCLTYNGWSGGKTRLFLVMLYRQHSWADLQVIIHHRFDPLTTQFISIQCLTVNTMMAASWSSRSMASVSFSVHKLWGMWAGYSWNNQEVLVQFHLLILKLLLIYLFSLVGFAWRFEDKYAVTINSEVIGVYNVVHSYELSFLQDWWRTNAILYLTAGHNILRYADTPGNMP